MRKYSVEVLQQGQANCYTVVADSHQSTFGGQGQTLIHFFDGKDNDKRPKLCAAIVVSARDSVVITWQDAE